MLFLIFLTLSIYVKNLSVISLDFLKAFDRVDWDFVFSAFAKVRIWREIHSHG